MLQECRTDWQHAQVAPSASGALSTHEALPVDGAVSTVEVSKKRVDDDDGEDWELAAWNIDGSGGHYHHVASLRLVMWAQIMYVVSLVVIIPTAAGYAAELGNTSAVYFGAVIGISSIINPLVSRLWNSVLRVTSLGTVLQINASINLMCSLLYVLAKFAGGDVLLLISRCLLGVGSVQTASLKYLGCAVSTKKVKFAHFLTTAVISYGFAFGTLLAFGLSLLASYFSWDQHTLPGYFTAWMWLAYLPMHRQWFREPDVNASIIGPESRVRLNRDMRPLQRQEPFHGLIPCFVAIFVVAMAKGAFEVMTIEITRYLWKWEVMTSALYLGVIMLVVAATTLLSYKLVQLVGESRAFVGGLVIAAMLIPFYYIPVSLNFQDEMSSIVGMVLYLIVSILALSALNLGRTIAFTLTTELPTPHWRNYFLSLGSEIFTVGRGFGPILAGAIDDKQRIITALLVGCAIAAMAVAVAHTRRAFDHEGHELGPARAEEGDDLREDIDSVVRSVDEWLAALYSAEAGRTASSTSASKTKTCQVAGAASTSGLPTAKGAHEGIVKSDGKQHKLSHKQAGL
mmetsp:Transcript_16398/g.47478  ORF Transcript_16398/g.47478 Transcript_16398/m.47478 type:complete len:570 (-) Transcript_16398:112-1821(-)